MGCHLEPQYDTLNVLDDIRGAIGAVSSQDKEKYIKAFITYPTKKDEVFKQAIVHVKNDEEHIPWNSIIETEVIVPGIHRIYDYELLKDFLLVLRNVSVDMLLDLCDDVIIDNSGFHLLRITNTMNNYGIVAFVEINHYRKFLLRNKKKNDGVVVSICAWVRKWWGLAPMFILFVILSMKIDIYLREKKIK